MKKSLAIILSSIFYFNFVYAQINRFVSGSYLELESFSKEETFIFSDGSNQARLAKLKNLSASIFSERKYFLEELSNYSVSIALPSRYGNFAWNGSYAGSALYNHTELGLVYARSLGEKIDLGIQFNYHAIGTLGYAGMSAITAEIGSIIHLTDKLQTGIHIGNPKGGKLNKNGTDKIPSLYAFGMGYDASDKFFLATEITKEEGQAIDIKMGFRYQLLPFLLIRAGLNSSVSTLWYGIGLSWKNVGIDLITNFHQQLGITPGILIAFKGKRRVDE